MPRKRSANSEYFIWTVIYSGASVTGYFDERDLILQLSQENDRLFQIDFCAPKTNVTSVLLHYV